MTGPESEPVGSSAAQLPSPPSPPSPGDSARAPPPKRTLPFDIDQALSQPVKRLRYARRLLTQAEESPEPSSAGVVERISLRNFMCHDHLEIEFGPQLNFIIGHNGSGKLAVLTGLSVGLGAKASDTNRGNSLKKLIKRGKNTARITIVLANSGPELYKPDVYGSRVVVERVLQREGAAKYSLKLELGRVMLHKKGDLDEMLERFGIPVNNPMAFLSQDAARTFLTAALDLQKYKFYEMGLHIFQNKNDLQETSGHLVAMHSKIALLRDGVTAAAARRQDARKRYEQFKRGRDLKSDKRLLEAKLVWLEVQRLEEKRVMLEEKQEANRHAVVELETRMRELQEAVENHSAITREAERGAEQAREQQEKAEQEGHQLEEAADSANRARAVAEGEMALLLQTAEQNRAGIAERHQRIKAERDRMDRLNGGSGDELKLRLDQLEQERQELADKLVPLVAEIALYDETTARQAEPLETEVRDLDRQVGRLNHRRQELALLQLDLLQLFGRGTKAVLQEIAQRALQFKLTPIGPMGRYVGINPGFEEFLNPINTVLAKLLDLYLVSCREDERVLRQILQRHREFRGIIVRKPTRFDYSRGVPPPPLRLFLDAMAFKNEDVKYALIDLHHIELTVLVKHHDAARRVLAETQGNRISGVVTLFDRQLGQRYVKTKSGAHRVDPVIYVDRVLVLQTSGVLQQQIRDCEEQLKHVREQHRVKTLELGELKLERRQGKLALLKQERQVRDRTGEVAREARRAEAVLTDLGDLAVLLVLEEEIVHLQQELEVTGNGVRELEEDVEESRTRAEECHALVEQSKAARRAAARQVEAAQARIELLALDLEVNYSRIVQLERAREERNAKSAKYAETLEQLALHVAIKEADATAVMPRAECALDRDTDTEEQLARRLRHVQAAITDLELRQGTTFDDAQQELQEALASYDRVHAAYNEFQQVHGKIDQDVEERALELVEQVARWTDLMNRAFQLLLQHRGFDGELVFDHAAKELHMRVSKNGAELRGIETLSGGEKLFTQLALLLAIWQPMRARIRGLDEFDVYMDLVNRKMALRIMLLTLRKFPKLQTIFITPQEIADVDEISADDVHIHRIADPRG